MLIDFHILSLLIAYISSFPTFLFLVVTTRVIAVDYGDAKRIFLQFPSTFEKKTSGTAQPIFLGSLTKIEEEDAVSEKKLENLKTSEKVHGSGNYVAAWYFGAIALARKIALFCP